MVYECPKCGKYGIAWDARGKVLMCYYIGCNYVVRMPGHDPRKIPTDDEVKSALAHDWNEQAQRKISAAEALCQIYFEIAAAAIGEDAVRAQRDARLAELEKEKEATGP